MELTIRPRRLRTNGVVRELVRETRIAKSSLIYPVFVEEGKNIVAPISSMAGQNRYSPDTVLQCAEVACKAGVQNLLLFGVPKEKDAIGSAAYAEDGALQQAVHNVKQEFPHVNIITDVCMCEYTSHGHCGILNGQNVDNDQTLEVLAKIAVSHVQAGADMVAPSDMMDGRVGIIRKALDASGYTDKAILSYAVKYASGFYGPFRDAAACG